MNALRTRLGLDQDDEVGLTLVEVIIAMLIFALISTGAIYSMLSVINLTRDSRSAQVAANLAAQEIDLARDVDDLFDLVDGERVITLNHDVFRVKRVTNWISAPDLDLRCGSGGGALRYKRVNVEVTWDNMRRGAEPVRSDTVIDPKNRINDPSLGTILVSVLNAGGTGASGVTVSAAPATPANGAVNLAETPRPTDAQGCTYILKVQPGNYTVTINKADHVDVTQAASSSTIVGVAAGSAASVGFQYDLAGTVTMRYGANYTARPFFIPNNLDTSYFSTYGTYLNTVTGNSNSTRTIKLHPFPAGYEVIAGKYAPFIERANPLPNIPGCVSPDPASWQPYRESGKTHSAVRPNAVATGPGGTENATIPMGVVTINTSLLSGLGGTHLRAVSAVAPGSAKDPGCAVPMTYTFGSVLPALGGQVSVALPYGSWKLYSGGSSSQSNLITSQVTVQTKGSFTAQTVTLDPRTIVTDDKDDDDDDD